MTVQPPGRTRSRRRKQHREPWGVQIKQIREHRGFSRTEVLARFQAELAKIDPDYTFDEIPGEAWLARIEKGETINVNQKALYLLCQALQCTLSERIRVMAAADRNVLANLDGETSLEAEVLMFAMMCLHANPDVRTYIRMLMRDRNFFMLSEADGFTIIAEVIQLILPSSNDGPTLEEAVGAETYLNNGASIHRGDNSVNRTSTTSVRQDDAHDAPGAEAKEENA